MCGVEFSARLVHAPERPAYALQAHGVDGVLEPLTSFEEIATAYIREIREVQPHGPYRFPGDCLRGVLALEMAQQLRAQGDEVALVAMFDSFHPRDRPYLPTPLYGVDPPHAAAVRVQPEERGAAARSESRPCQGPVRTRGLRDSLPPLTLAAAATQS